MAVVVPFESPKNTAARIGDDVEIQKFEERPVHVLIVYDLTISRNQTRDAHVTQFKTQMTGLEKAAGNVVISLAVHNKQGAGLIGTYSNPRDVGAALEKIPCTSNETQIVEAIDSAMARIAWQRGVAKPDAILYIGDTTDGNGDGQFDLEAVARRHDVPVITMLETTTGQAGTKPQHKISMAAMSQASGIEGCPLPYDNSIKFADYFKILAALLKHGNDPKAMDELLKQVDPKVRAIFDNKIRESIARAHAASQQRAAEADPVKQAVQEITKPRKIHWGIHVASELLNGMAVYGLAVLALIGSKELQRKDPELKQPVIETKIDTAPILRGDRVIVDEHSKVLFDTGKSTLTPAFKVFLDDLTQKLKENPGSCLMLDVSGYTDPRGSNDHNDRLSLDRANAVRKDLVGRGVDRGQVRTFGYGKRNLLPRSLGMSDVEFNKINRRVGFQCVVSHKSPAPQ
jgi:outer membrane protein OmpA-like peptidoglycan-associated protein